MLKKITDIHQKKHYRTNISSHYQSHTIRLNLPHTSVENIIKKLVNKGFEAYLVGGAVRDLLLGITPKDFDVATNATPEQIEKIFRRRSRIIGKRFPIVHVMSGNEIIEVSTFRSGKAHQNANGRIIKDNGYGTLEQDATRRDFTCNALYYDVIEHKIIDFHQGIDHIKMKKLIMIGEPTERYQEDPVRILRAIRLSGKLGFTLDEATAAPIIHYAHLLKNEPVSRLFDELMKILFSGHAQNCLKYIQVLGINTPIHPLLTALQQSTNNKIIIKSLYQTDQRLQQGKSVSMGFILAALFWHELNSRWQKIMTHDGQSSVAAMQTAISNMRKILEYQWGVPQRYGITMREIWSLQPYFELRQSRHVFRLLKQPRFRAAYDFLMIRAEFGEVSQELVNWWAQFQNSNDDVRNQMINQQSQLNQPAKHQSRKRKPKKNHVIE